MIPKIITGLPEGVKARPRADFKPTEFDKAIIEKGYRLYWSRAALCPCSNNEQTDQPDITCGLCKGKGYWYFVPDAAIRKGATEDAHGNPVELSPAKDGVIVQAIMTSLTKDVQIFEKFGEWVFGMTQVTTQHQNKLGYRDRLVAVDSIMSWAQVIEYDGTPLITVSAGRNRAGLRYPVVNVNMLRTMDTELEEFTDYEVTTDGDLQLLGTVATTLEAHTPQEPTRLTLHYNIHPTWIVLDHLHTYRDSLVAEKAASSAVADQYTRLPIQVIAKLDFLIDQ